MVTIAMSAFSHSDRVKKRVGRPPGSGWLEQAIAGNLPPGEWTITEAAEALGTSYLSVAHCAAAMVKRGHLLRVRRGVYRHLTEAEWP